MPHVVIEDAGDLGIACQGLKLTTVQNGSEILKVVDVYLNRSSRTALIDCLYNLKPADVTQGARILQIA